MVTILMQLPDQRSDNIGTYGYTLICAYLYHRSNGILGANIIIFLCRYLKLGIPN